MNVDLTQTLEGLLPTVIILGLFLVVASAMFRAILKPLATVIVIALGLAVIGVLPMATVQNTIVALMGFLFDTGRLAMNEAFG